MKALRMILASAAAILAVACTQEKLENNTKEGTLVFTATFENNDVKSTITDGKWVWEEGDQVLVTDGTNKETVTLTAEDITENGAVAKIKTTTIPAGAEKYFAVTPPRKYKRIVDGTDIELSAASSYTSNEIKTVIAATTGSTFAFKNVYSLLKFDTKLAFSRATMTATNIGDNKALMHVCKFNPETGEYLWGDFSTVNPTLSRGDNESGPYYIEFVPHALPNGFTLTLYDENKAELVSFTRTEALTPVRGHIYNIANFDKRVGVDDDEPIFYESFDGCDGTGGNDGEWSGSIASKTIQQDNEGWTYAKGNGADKCAKFGSGSAKGSAETPSISLAAGTYTLTFKAGAWNGSSEGTTLNVSATNCLLSQESVTLIKGAFSDYSIVITCTSAADVKIKFEAEKVSNNRFFLDEVKVVAGGDMPDYLNVSEEEVTVACDATTASFDIESNVAWTITSDSEVTVTPDSGDGNSTITVSGIQPNASAAERTISTLTIAGGEGLTKTVVIKQEGDPDAIEDITIAQFLAKEVGSTLYRISGTIDNITNASYGNLTLTDGSNSVYVYGVKKDKDAGNQTFGELDLVAGDGLTIVCKRGEYNSDPQAQDAYQVAMVHQPRLSISPESLYFGASGGSEDITVTCKYFDGATISATSSNTAFSTSVSGTTVTVTAASNTTPSELTGSITITATNGSTTKTGEVSVSQNAAVSEPTGIDGYVRVDDTAWLHAGDKVVIAAADYDFAMSTTQNTSNRGQAAVTKGTSGSFATLTLNGNVQEFTLVAGIKANTWAFQTSNGYIYAASSSSNYLKSEGSLSDNSSWTVAITSGTATITAQGEYTRNVLQYNQSSSLFACYSSASQKAVSIYKWYGEMAQPTKLATPSPSFSNNTVSWSAITDAQGYKVKVDAGEEVSVHETSFSLASLSAGTYSVIVKAVGNGTTTTDSDWSTAISCTVTGGGTTGKYVKITKTSDLTDGTYLVVYEDGNLAMDGSLSTLDAVSNSISVSISNGEIASNATVDASTFTFTASNGSFLGKGGKYFGNTSDSNALTSSTTAMSNTVSIDTDGNAVIKASGGSYLRYNATSGQTRFRFFKSGTYTSQKAIQLYKYVAD